MPRPLGRMEDLEELTKTKMKVVLFKNVVGENRPSMDHYAEELLGSMPDNVEGFTIQAKKFPFFRHYYHKEIIYLYVSGKNQGDVNHISDHSYAGLLRCLDPKKTVVTCHDLIPLDRPQESSVLGRIRYRLNVKYLSRAAKIIAVSQHTKQCVLRHLSIPEEKISVVYNGVSRNFRVLDDRDRLKTKYGVGRKTLLHVGTSYPRKNVELILNLLIKRGDVGLIKVGGFTEKQGYLIGKNTLGGRIKQYGSVDENTLVELYNVADALVMPSFAEGFGIPVLEAMACGCPVVCSDIEVFHELYDKAAVFADPHSLDDSLSKLDAVLSDSNLVNKLIKKGLEKSKEFSWRKCAQETYKIYEEIYNEEN